MLGGDKDGWVRLNGRRHQLLYVLAAFVERDEWGYVGPESLIKAIKLLASEEDIVVIEEDELGGDMLVRLREEDD